MFDGCCILAVKCQATDKLGMTVRMGAVDSEEIVGTGGDRSDVGRNC